MLQYHVFEIMKRIFDSLNYDGSFRLANGRPARGTDDTPASEEELRVGGGVSPTIRLRSHAGVHGGGSYAGKKNTSFLNSS